MLKTLTLDSYDALLNDVFRKANKNVLTGVNKKDVETVRQVVGTEVAKSHGDVKSLSVFPLDQLDKFRKQTRGLRGAGFKEFSFRAPKTNTVYLYGFIGGL